MPMNGSGVWERTPGTLIANQGALVSAQVNNETNNLVDGINAKLSLSGQLPMTAPLTLHSATAALHAATLAQVQLQTATKSASVGGTVDAITVVMAPVTTAYATGQVVRWTSGGANTVTAPTINRDGLGAKIIKKGASAALVAGDTGVSGYLNTAIYNGTDFILQNPATTASVPSASDTVAGIVELATPTEAITGTDTARAVTPQGVYAAISNIAENGRTADYTLVLTDAGKMVRMNVASANVITIPLNSSVAFVIGTRIDIAQWGAGQTSITPTGGVTLNSNSTKRKLTGQYSGGTLWKQGTDTWMLFGDITV